MTKPTLYYLAARGRAELIRLILAEAGVDYVEHVVGQGTKPMNGRPTDFKELKASGFLPFGAVPVWEEPDGFVLAQSAAIASHLGRTHGLCGKTPRHAAQCDQMLGAFDDVRAELRKVYLAAAEARAGVREQLTTEILPRWFGHLDRLLKSNAGGAGFVVGESVSVADLALWYLIELCRDNELGAPIAARPELVAFYERIASRPRIAAYLSSARRPPLAPMPR